MVPQGRSGRVWKISPFTGIRSPDRPARSESALPTELSRPVNRHSYEPKFQYNHINPIYILIFTLYPPPPPNVVKLVNLQLEI